MSVTGPSTTELYSSGYEAPRGFGWSIFAGTMLLLVSFITGLWGIAALSQESYFRGELLTGSLETWGWILLCVATVQGIAGLLVFIGSKTGAVLGIIVASVNFIGHLFAVGGYPIWSVTAMVIDVLIIYGLCAYGFDES